MDEPYSLSKDDILDLSLETNTNIDKKIIVGEFKEIHEKKLKKKF